MGWLLASLVLLYSSSHTCSPTFCSLLMPSALLPLTFFDPLHLPTAFSCRHEIVGIVVDVGNQVSKFKVGDRAGLGVLVDTCRECQSCKMGEEMYCPKIVLTYNAKHPDGEVQQGGYSTHIINDEK